MYSNTNTIEDDNGEFSDWIEIYNASNSAMNLLGFALSDDEDDLLKWTFPDVEIEANGFVLVFANGQEMSDALETNFKLDASGESLFLSNPSSEVLDEIGDEAQPSNISIGRVPDGGNAFGVLLYPSPEFSNHQNNIINFSSPSGYYTEAVNLDLNNSSPEDEEIYYTLDGSMPTEESNLFTENLMLESRVGDPNIFSDIITTLSAGNFVPDQEMFKLNTLRVVSFRDGIQTSPVYSKTYAIDEDMFNRYDFPLISLITEGSNFFDYDTGIYVPGVNYSAGNSIWTGNYFGRGIEWERDVHLEFFEQNGDLAFKQDCGVRIHGGRSRGSRQKSLQLYARKEYGHKNFPYSFFEESEKDEYKRIILRTATACWNKTVIKDAVTHRICTDLDMEMMNARPAVLFVNGEYWGVHGVRDVLDIFHLAELADEEEEEINILVHGSGINPSYDESWGILEGSNEDYIDLMEFIEANDLSQTENYAFVETQLDVSSMIDYYCAEIFFNNKDWVKNNHKVWKGSDDESKWRWLFYDLDGGWGYQPNNWNLFEACLAPEATFENNPPYSTMLFRNMMESPIYYNSFLERMACLLKDEFSEANLIEHISEYQSILEPGIEEQILRWDRPTSMISWTGSILSNLTQFAEQRQGFVIGHIEDQFDIDFNIGEYDCTPVIDVDEQDDHYSQLLIYPNPVKNTLFIDNKTGESISRMEIYNQASQILYSEAYTKSLDISSFSSGFYILKIYQGNEVLVKKFIKL